MAASRAPLLHLSGWGFPLPSRSAVAHLSKSDSGCWNVRLSAPSGSASLCREPATTATAHSSSGSTSSDGSTSGCGSISCGGGGRECRSELAGPGKSQCYSRLPRRTWRGASSLPLPARQAPSARPLKANYCYWYGHQSPAAPTVPLLRVIPPCTCIRAHLGRCRIPEDERGPRRAPRRHLPRAAGRSPVAHAAAAVRHRCCRRPFALLRLPLVEALGPAGHGPRDVAALAARGRRKEACRLLVPPRPGLLTYCAGAFSRPALLSHDAVAVVLPQLLNKTESN